MVVRTRPNIPSRTEQVVEQLHELVRSSDLQPGDAFATEAELQERFNVSRHVVREAVSRLRALGILDSRQSLGLIVGRADPAGLFEKAIQSWSPGSADLKELGILRYTLEIGAVEPAVKAGDRRAARDDLSDRRRDGPKAVRGCAPERGGRYGAALPRKHPETGPQPDADADASDSRGILCQRR